MTSRRVGYRTCPICEASCGLALELDGSRVVRVRGDEHDVLSRGYLCPKGAALDELHHDPDRLRTPLVRGDGRRASRGDVGTRRSPKSSGAHRAGDRAARPARRSRSTSAIRPRTTWRSTTDFPMLGAGRGHHAAATPRAPSTNSPSKSRRSCMYGTSSRIPVPDVDRTEYLLVLGANPAASNGSLMIAPDLRGRLDAIRARGGRSWWSIHGARRPPSAPTSGCRSGPAPTRCFLFALVHALFAEERVALGRARAARARPRRELERSRREFSPEAVADAVSDPRAHDSHARARARRRRARRRLRPRRAPARRSSARSRAGWSTC